MSPYLQIYLVSCQFELVGFFFPKTGRFYLNIGSVWSSDYEYSQVNKGCGCVWRRFVDVYMIQRVHVS